VKPSARLLLRCPFSTGAPKVRPEKAHQGEAPGKPAYGGNGCTFGATQEHAGRVRSQAGPVSINCPVSQIRFRTSPNRNARTAWDRTRPACSSVAPLVRRGPPCIYGGRNLVLLEAIDNSFPGLQKRSFLQLLKGLPQLLLRIHDDWSLPRHRLFKRFTGDKQETNAVLAGLYDDLVTMIKQYK
jgi:hypothetical protein